MKSIIDNKTCVDLFKIAIEHNEQHTHFKKLMQDNYEPVRDVLKNWAIDFKDRDGKFSKEFQTTFNSSFWELYLHKTFKELGMEIDYSRASPDFFVKTNLNNYLSIEAVTSNNAKDDPPEWNSPHNTINHQKSLEDILNYSCIRLSNAIASKYKKYIQSYSKMEHVKNKPFILAVAPFEQKLFFTQNNGAILRVLYGQGVQFNIQTELYEELPINSAKKNEYVDIELGIFTNDKYKFISAVIFSTTATFGKAVVQSTLDVTVRSTKYHSSKGGIVEFIENNKYNESHFEGLQIFHNPFAEYPLNENEFDRYEITHYNFDIILKKINNKQRNNTLISRNILPSNYYINRLDLRKKTFYLNPNYGALYKKSIEHKIANLSKFIFHQEEKKTTLLMIENIKIMNIHLCFLQLNNRDNIKLKSIETLFNKEIKNLKDKLSEESLFFEEKITIEQEFLGVNHMELIKSYNIIGIFYQLQNKHEEAIPYYNKCLEIVKNNTMGDYDDPFNIYGKIAAIYDLSKNYEKSLFFYKKSIDSIKKSTYCRDIDLSIYYLNLSKSWLLQGKTEESRETYKNFLEIGRKNLQSYLRVNNSTTELT